MAIITTSSFDPLKARCNVRLQQGVPIVDADWNEFDDIRKFELRAYLKWYVGDGIPAGNDGFRIDPQSPAAPDDFIIRAGVAVAAPGTPNITIGLQNAGRCIVDGLDVIISADIAYKSQPLYAAPGIDGSPQIAPIPAASETLAVYLDVWERLITAQEDPSLVLPGLGTESCARMARQWCVRTRAGTTPPAAADPDYLAGHSTYLLALLNQTLIEPGVALPIKQSSLIDQRHTGLSMAAMESRLAKVERLLLLPSFSTTQAQLQPAAAITGQPINLIGRNFDIGTPQVTIGGLVANISGTPTNTVVSVNVPMLTSGASYPVSITTDGGGPVFADTLLEIPGGGLGGVGGALAPAFAAASPLVPAVAAPNQNILINGTNFTQPGLAVTFGAKAAVIVATTATQITVTVPAIAAGICTIAITTSAGTTQAQFTVI